MIQHFFLFFNNYFDNNPLSMTLHLRYWNCKEENRFGVFNHADQPYQQPSQLLVTKSATLYRHKKNNHLITSKHIKNEEKDDYEVFVVLRKNGEQFTIANAHPTKTEDIETESLFQIATTDFEKQAKLPLKVGKVLKLGIVNIVIEKLQFSGQLKSEIKTFYDQKLFQEIEPIHKIGTDFYEDCTQASTIEQAPVCRYCFSKSLQKGNEFLTLCKCQGSSKYVHEQCLSSWVIQRCKYRQTKTGVFLADKNGLQCEICKEKLPAEKIFPCFEESKFKDYLIISSKIEKQQTLYIVGLDKSRCITVGRKVDCDIVIEDPSVSRFHCQFLWDKEEGSLTVMDLGSKFGTLLKKSSTVVGSDMLLQRGRTKFLVGPTSGKFALGKALKSFFNL